MTLVSPHALRSWVVSAVVLLGLSHSAGAQPTAVRAVNPALLEFDVPDQRTGDVYRLELFHATDNPRVDAAVRAIDVNASGSQAVGTVRVDLRTRLRDVPPGEYIATIRTIRAESQSERSQPSAPFWIASGDAATSTDAAFAGEPVDPDRERFWKRVAIAVAAGVLLLPVILR